MKYLLFALIILIIFLIWLLMKSFKSSYVLTFIVSMMILYFILNPQLCMSASVNGAKLFFNSVFPALFPFVVMTSILISFDGITIYSKFLGPILCKPLGLPRQCSFALVVSSLCGYPLGAKYSSKLYEDGLITKSQYAKLLNVASNASPLFIIGSIGFSMLGNIQGGYIILLSNYISCIIMALIIKCDNTELSIANSKLRHNDKNFGTILKESIEEALKTSLSVGSFIVMFSVILSIIKNNAIYNIVLKNIISNFSFISEEIFSGISLGLIEITNGSYSIAHSNLNFSLKLSLISFLCAFSGLSIIAQVHSFTYKYKELSIKKYVLRKFIQGIISFIVTLGISKLYAIDSAYTFSHSYKSFINSPIIPLIIFLSISTILLGIKTLFDAS